MSVNSMRPRMAGLVQRINPQGRGQIMLVCEHASNHIPPCYDALGLTEIAARSHIAWDPGAIEVAQAMAGLLDAKLIAGGVSRLIYDCNRPPDAVDAMPERSEIYDIPGNANLSATQRAHRVSEVYEPFRRALADTLDAQDCLVTIHSFTPLYHGQTRDVEIGILHGADARLADAMLKIGSQHTALNVQRNAPYGPEDGVAHTLEVHAPQHLASHASTPQDRATQTGRLNVMIEIRNDLIATAQTQTAMARLLSDWLTAALAPREVSTCPD